ncbi:DUF58 domain-containing protein [Paenibacillus xanthanilyticus]|uniref:DUF58 domain-containing protein n=1 Tax=Paenibacillus xanthanilyticus TaxID=1783531 RepID=A0ABV8JUF9_9BACL
MSGRSVKGGARGSAPLRAGDGGIAGAEAGRRAPGSGRARNKIEARITAEGRRDRRRERPVRTRHGARLMLLAFAAVAGWAAQARGGAAEWLLFAAAAAASAVAWIVPYLGVGRLTAERRVEAGRLEDGGQLTVRLTIRASLPMPLMWVAVGEEIRNVSASGESGLEARFVYMPWFRRTRTLTYTISGLRRGELTFDGPIVACGDLLGMTARTFYPSCAGSVTVRPRPPRGEAANPPGGAMPGGVDAGGAGAAAGAAAWQRDSRMRLQPGASPQTRTYRPGDPLRLVSWRAMARGLGMQTRVGSPEPPGEIALLLDISAASYAGSDRQFDAAAGRAAAALREAVDAGRSATLLAGGRRWRVRAGDGAALLAAEEALGQLRVSEETRLDEWLPAALAGLPRGADVVCVTADPRSINPAAGYGARAGRAARKAAGKAVSDGAGDDASDGNPAMAGNAAGLESDADAKADPGGGHAVDRDAKANGGAGLAGDGDIITGLASGRDGSSERQADERSGAAGETAAKLNQGGRFARGEGREFGQVSASRAGRKANRRRDAKAAAAFIDGVERVAASAKWVQSRGGTFHLWIGIGSAAGPSDSWIVRGSEAGIQVVPLKLTASYLAEPVITAGYEKGAVGNGRA